MKKSDRRRFLPGILRLHRFPRIADQYVRTVTLTKSERVACCVPVFAVLTLSRVVPRGDEQTGWKILWDARGLYVASVSLNGVPVTHAYVRHDQIMAAGELRFTLQSMPNTVWAAGAADRPYASTRSQ
jgi:hypothetical protein